MCVWRPWLQKKKNKRSYKNPRHSCKQIPAGLGPLELPKRPPVAKANKVPVWRKARCLLLRRRERAERTCCLGDFADTCWEGQNAGIASSITGFWEETCWTQTFLQPPQNTEVSCSLFYSIPYVSLHQGEKMQTSIPLPWVQKEILNQTCRLSWDYSHPENTAAITEQFLSRPCPPPSPWGTDPSWVGAVGEQPPCSREKPEPALQGWDFSLKHQPSTCKLRGLKCSLSGRVWQENEVKVTLLPNLNSTVVLELLKLADILLFQGKQNFFFPFSKKLVVPVPHQPRAIHAYVHKHTHTHRAALPLKFLHC